MRLQFWKKEPKPAPPAEPSAQTDTQARWRRLEALAPTIVHAPLIERQAFMLELYRLMLEGWGNA